MKTQYLELLNEFVDRSAIFRHPLLFLEQFHVLIASSRTGHQKLFISVWFYIIFRIFLYALFYLFISLSLPLLNIIVSLFFYKNLFIRNTNFRMPHKEQTLPINNRKKKNQRNWVKKRCLQQRALFLLVCQGTKIRVRKGYENEKSIAR